MSPKVFQNRGRAVVLCASAALVAAVAFVGSHSLAQDGVVKPQSSQATASAVEHGKQLSLAFRSAAEAALPTVVTITARTRPVTLRRGPRSNPLEGTPFERFFNEDDFGGPTFRTPRQRGVGSGLIIDSSGVVLTNNHVVDGADRVTVRLADGREFEARDIKTDPDTDLAVLHIENAGDLPAAKLGDSDKLEIGDWVIAVGTPFNLEHTVSAGIISGRGRKFDVEQRTDYLQTDAAINPGNSGGPLVNLDGQVVGINTAIASNSGGYQGVGFAIPINLAKWVADQLVKGGAVERAFLGVQIKPLTPDLAEQFGVPRNSGALITHVQPDSPAGEAGFEAGDVIVSFAGKKVSDPGHLQTLVERSPKDSKQSIEVIRQGEVKKLSVVVRSLPKGDARARRGQDPTEEGAAVESTDLGFDVVNLTPEIAQQLEWDVNEGVVIRAVDPDGPAAEAGLRAGMVVLRVGKQRVNSVEEFRAALEKQPADRGVLLHLGTREGNDFVVVPRQ